MSRPTDPPQSPPGHVTVPPPGTYRIDPARSAARLHVKHMFGLGTVHATVDPVDGELVVVEPTTGSSVRAVFDARTFSSGGGLRDKHVAGPSLLDSGTYPEIRFMSRTVRADGPGWAIDGTLVAHGTTRDVTLHLDRAEPVDGGVHVHATTQIDRTDFGITKKRGMVGRTVEVELDIHAVRATG